MWALRLKWKNNHETQHTDKYRVLTDYAGRLHGTQIAGLIVQLLFGCVSVGTNASVL